VGDGFVKLGEELRSWIVAAVGFDLAPTEPIFDCT
jgi:hypothetical protein